MGNGYVAGFFGDYYCYGLGGLGYAEGRAVTEAEGARYVAVVAHGEDASGGFDAVVGDYHGAVVEGGVFEEYVFDESGVDVCVDDIT